MRVLWPKNPSSPNTEELAGPCIQQGTKSLSPGSSRPNSGQVGVSEKPFTEPWVSLIQIKLAFLGLEPVVLGRSFLEEVLTTPEYQAFRGDPRASSFSYLICKIGTVTLPRLKAGPHLFLWAVAQVCNERWVWAV